MTNEIRAQVEGQGGSRQGRAGSPRGPCFFAFRGRFSIGFSVSVFAASYNRRSHIRVATSCFLKTVYGKSIPLVAGPGKGASRDVKLSPLRPSFFASISLANGRPLTPQSAQIADSDKSLAGRRDYLFDTASGDCNDSQLAASFRFVTEPLCEVFEVSTLAGQFLV